MNFQRNIFWQVNQDFIKILKTGLILNEDSLNIFYSNDELEQILDKASSLDVVIPKNLYNEIITILMASIVFTTPYDKNVSLLKLMD